MFQILAISGSLRSGSSNTALLEAAALVAPEPIQVVVYRGLGSLPHFNPDVEDPLPPPVSELRDAVGECDGIVFSTPEYAHGVPGALKNALDWLVSGPEMMNKPVALFNASSRSTYAQEALREVLRTMSAAVLTAADLTLPLLGRGFSAAEIAADPGYCAHLLSGLETFRRTAENIPLHSTAKT